MTNLSTDFKTNISLLSKLANEIFPNNPLIAKLVVAQAILESNLTYFPSKLALANNNLFGIKWSKGGRLTGNLAHSDYFTKEYSSYGGWSRPSASFVKFGSIDDCVEFMSKLYSPDGRYANLYKASSFEEAAQVLHDAGYATDPSYKQQLVAIYKKYLQD